MFALVVYFVGSHLFSFLCSIFESALLSCTDGYVDLLKKKGDKRGVLIGKLRANIDRPLAAILTLNTISHTIGAAGVGASIVELYGEKWLALGSIILTLTMLYWTEMLPKTVGALFWKRLILICARPINGLIVLTYPFVFSFNLFAKLLSKGRKKEGITEEDIRIALEAGAKAGVIEEAEQDMVENIFRLGDRRVGVLMCPRVDIEWLDLEDSCDQIRDQILASSHHCFPIAKGDIDEVEGIIHARDLLSRAWRKEPIILKELAKPPHFVHENQLIFELMEFFHAQEETLALVTDEYGTIQGMITLGDIMGAIIEDVEESKIVQVNPQSWLLQGDLPIDEFKEIFHFETLPEEERARFRTLSGLCMSQLEAVPRKGDTFSLSPYRFEIVKMKQRRVEKVLLTKLSD
ncbi:MAG: Magnesium and cobalt efflux protein CorC [Chlamydiae bacterium]|nr:Magnesium and cobalt efflux protein CorC [Chlamydiota bacterium]